MKLTWDDDDPERNHVTRRALTKKEIEENDFRAYIANTSSESEGEGANAAPAAGKQKKKKTARAERDKMRALLLGGNDDAMPEGWGDDASVGGLGEADDVDMEITFTPGISAAKPGDETTLEKYQRRMREKRKKRKEEGPEKAAAGKKTTGEGNKQKVDDEFFEAGSEDEGTGAGKDRARKGKSTKSRQEEVEEEDKPARKEATEEELALLVASSNPDAEPKHFNLKSVIKAEKSKKRRKGKKDKKEDDGEAQEDFVVNVKDDRFKVLFEDHQFAIDPTNPQFVFLADLLRILANMFASFPASKRQKP